MNRGDEGVTDAKVTRWAAVTYPRAAERQRAAGTTEMSVLVGADGRVETVRVAKSSGFDLLDREAERVARANTYSGARKNGVRVKMWIPVRVTFARP